MTEPLDLAVHSLPSAEHPVATQPTVSGRIKLLGFLVLCSLPVLTAYWVYFFVRPGGQAGLGEFIEPVRPTPAVLARSALDQREHLLTALKGQWLLVSVAHGDCTDECQRRLFVQRQLRATLGKDKERVDWVWLIDDTTPVPPAMQEPLKSGVAWRVDPATLAAWLPVAPGKALGDYIFVVDPMGNAMMRFPARLDTAAATKARRDLDRVLRASAAWDAPGR